MNRQNNELYHYGILGMKWGVRRFQDENGRLTSSGKKRYSYGSNKKKNEEDNSNKKKFELTDKQKKYIKIGAAAATTALIAYGGYRIYKDSNLLQMKARLGQKNLQFLRDNNIGPSTKLGKVKGIDLDALTDVKIKKISSPESISDVASKVNRTRSHNNCWSCVTAVTGRLCGLDVYAKSDNFNGSGMDFGDICKVFKLNPDNEMQVKIMSQPTLEKLERAITRRYKEGDTGAIGLSWNSEYKKLVGINIDDDCAHTLSWCIKDGAVNFIDGQPGVVNGKIKTMLSTFMDSGKEVRYAKFANTINGINLENDVDIDLLKKMVDI